jgi:hypothetical protein
MSQDADECTQWKDMALHVLRRIGTSPGNVERVCLALRECGAPGSVGEWIRAATAPIPRSREDVERSEQWRADTRSKLEAIGIEVAP